MIHTQQQPLERSALCSTCPTPEDVTHALQVLGFALTFQMKAQKTYVNPDIPPLGAQFHYAGPQGSEVIYLAGPDRPNASLPPHASRFWVYSGASPVPAQQAMHVLSRAWSLTWYETDALDTNAA